MLYWTVRNRKFREYWRGKIWKENGWESYRTKERYKFLHSGKNKPTTSGIIIKLQSSKNKDILKASREKRHVMSKEGKLDWKKSKKQYWSNAENWNSAYVTKKKAGAGES